MHRTRVRAGTAPIRIDKPQGYSKARTGQYPSPANLGGRGFPLKGLGKRFEPVGNSLGAFGESRVR